MLLYGLFFCFVVVLLCFVVCAVLCDIVRLVYLMRVCDRVCLVRHWLCVLFVLHCVVLSVFVLLLCLCVYLNVFVYAVCDLLCNVVRFGCC